MGQLDGKVACVTGGTRSIGRGIAEAFLAEGASVVVNGRSQEKGEKALAEMGAGDRAHFIAGDVLRREDIDAVVDGTVERYGRIDIMVNNAGGGGGFAPVAEMSDEVFDYCMKWSLYSVFWGTRAALRHMIPQQSGRIIQIGSVEGKHGKAGIAHYVTAKHAINGLSKSTCKEVGTLGITVNVICPGLIDTDQLRETGTEAAAAMGLTYEEMVDMFAQEAAIKRLNTVEEVGAMAVLLASDLGAGITGALLNVDGGTAQY